MYANAAVQNAVLRPTIPPNADGVLAALRRAADETGTDFGYLLNTAMRESSLNPKAEAATSSATGLFQFIEQTWLGTVKEFGGEHGLKTYADAIEVGSNGRFRVADPAVKQEILALRKDAKTAALMAGEMTNAVRGDMEAALGRGVSAGELYVAHFLGPKAAIKLIETAEATPKASAADIFPQAANANRSIFYSGGKARSAADVLAHLVSKHEGATVPPAQFAEAAERPAAPAAPDGDAGASSIFSFGGHSVVMAPIMVQILASLDPLSQLASSVAAEGEPELRRSAGDVI